MTRVRTYLIGISISCFFAACSADGGGGNTSVPVGGSSGSTVIATGGAVSTGGSTVIATGGTSGGNSGGTGGIVTQPSGGTNGTASGGTESVIEPIEAGPDGEWMSDEGGSSDAGIGEGGDYDAGTTVGDGRPCHSSVDWTSKPDDIWISPSGRDENPGTEASPKQHLSAAIAAWTAGKTIWVMPGTYSHSSKFSLSTNATSGAPLRISGVTGGDKPVFDFSGEPRATFNNGERGFEISGSYIHMRYLEVKKAADNCLYVTGANNTLEWLVVHECQDTGIQLSNGAASNQVLNVDSYLNADASGENADGFAPKLSIGQNNYFCGTRSYQNADDGYDCWASGNQSPVKFEYCWAFGHPGPTATANGDGNGFKLGSPALSASGGNAPHELIDCFAFHNRSAGFTANGNSSGQITCTNCGVWDNGTDWSAGSGGQTPQHTGDITNLDVSVDEAMNAPRDVRGNLPDITKLVRSQKAAAGG
ncbi:MAG: hypothetical protein JXA30_11195 [Deltaproteobacteria bacterium]|nr:hypothetical protein [Deltaproteobacteria bacterium]